MHLRWKARMHVVKPSQIRAYVFAQGITCRAFTSPQISLWQIKRSSVSQIWTWTMPDFSHYASFIEKTLQAYVLITNQTPCINELGILTFTILNLLPTGLERQELWQILYWSMIALYESSGHQTYVFSHLARCFRKSSMSKEQTGHRGGSGRSCSAELEGDYHEEYIRTQFTYKVELQKTQYSCRARWRMWRQRTLAARVCNYAWNSCWPEVYTYSVLALPGLCMVDAGLGRGHARQLENGLAPQVFRRREEVRVLGAVASRRDGGQAA